MLRLNIVLDKTYDIDTVVKRIETETLNMPLYFSLSKKSSMLLAFRERNSGTGDNNLIKFEAI